MTSIRPISQPTSAIYANLHRRLVDIAIAARKGEYSRFESVNRDTYTAARMHQQALEDNDGDALETAILAAGKWLSTL